MSSKLLTLFIIFCLLNVSAAFRLSRSLGTGVITPNESSEEVTEAKIDKLRASLMYHMPTNKADKIVRALRKMKKGETNDEQSEGFDEMIDLLMEGCKAKTALREAGIEAIQINLSATTSAVV